MSFLAFFATRTGMEILGVALLALFIWHFKNVYDDSIRAEVRAKEVAPLQAEVKAAEIRALKFSEALTAQELMTEQAQKDRKVAQDVSTQALAAKIKALSQLRSLRLSAGLISLWHSISADANSEEHAVPISAEPQPGAATVPAPAGVISEAQFGDWLNQARAAYKDAVGLFHDARAALHGCLAASQGVS